MPRPSNIPVRGFRMNECQTFMRLSIHGLSNIHRLSNIRMPPPSNIPVRGFMVTGFMRAARCLTFRLGGSWLGDSCAPLAV